MRNLNFGKSLLVILLLAMFLVSACAEIDDEVKEERRTDTSLEDVRSKGSLVIGVDAPFPPMEFFDEDGNLIGVDIDIIVEVANRLGVEPDIRLVDWDVLFDEVASGDLDVIISGITITPARQELMLFSNPYFNSGQIVLTTKTSEISSHLDLDGLVVGAQADTTSSKKASDLGAAVTEYVVMDVSSDAIQDLLTGEIDAIVVDIFVGSEIVKEFSALHIVGEPFTNEYSGIATAKGNFALINEINDVLRQMKAEGELDRIAEKWLN